MTRWMFLVAAFGLFVATPSLADRRPEHSAYAWVFEGAEGVTVTLVRVGHPDHNKALVRVEGIDHPLDGAIIEHKVAKKYGRAQVIEYAMPYDGKEWVTVVFDSHMPGKRTPYLFLPKEMTYNGKAEHGRPLRYNKELSRAVNVEHFLTEYLQKHKGMRR